MESSPEQLMNGASDHYDHLDLTGEQDSIQKYSDLDESLKFVQSLLTKKMPNGVEANEIQDQEMSEEASNDRDELSQNAENDEKERSEQEDYKMVDQEEELGASNHVFIDEHMDTNQELDNSDIGSQHAVNQSQISLNNAETVEDRLQIMNSIYQERRQAKLFAAEEERKRQEGNKRPTINRKSEQMLKRKAQRQGKIEDRLMNLAQKKKAEPEPQVNKSVISTSGKKVKPSAVVSRLMDYGALYKQKRVELEEQFSKKQTFKPNLDKSSEMSKSDVKSRYKVSKTIPTNRSPSNEEIYLKYGRSTEQNETGEDSKFDDQDNFGDYTENNLYTNSGFKEPTKKMQKIQDEYDKNHPFYPSINNTSKTMVETKSKNQIDYVRPSSDVHNRLYNLHFDKNKNKGEDDKFKPELNKNSEEIIRLMKEGNDYDKNERWRTLYEFGVEKQIMRKHIEDKVREIKEEEELGACPFTPEIIPYDQNQSADGPIDVVDRTKDWATSLVYKKEILAESHYKNKVMKEHEECTFKPKLIAEENLKRQNITASEMSAKVDIAVNSKGLESFYRRMEEAHYRKRQDDEYEEHYVGSGKNWTGLLTMPAIPDFHEKKNVTSLEQVKCVTKPVIRDGEIVRDAQVPIHRHEKYTKSDITNNLRGENRQHELENIKNKNEQQKAQLFDEHEEFDDCVDFLHNQIKDLEI
jgi:hypothetical protein